MPYPVISVSACSAAKIALPLLPGAEILFLSAALVVNYTTTAPETFNYNHPTLQAKGVDFCNITITYTHPGQEDSLGVETWLPPSTWNGRIQSVGGGGWVAGRFFLSYHAMSGAIAEGYVTSSVDAGLRGSSGEAAAGLNDWAMVSEGNVNLYNLQNFGSVSLGDQAILVRALTENFYGQRHEYAYCSGCSQGGRQGLMLAQRYPDAYDGIAAAAPAIYWPEFFSASIWAQYIREAAIAACDPLDGVIDGILAEDAACEFDPMTLIGDLFNCTNTGKMPRGLGLVLPDGDFLWYGPSKDARLGGSNGPILSSSDLGYAQTQCSNGSCSAFPSGLGDAWFSLFVQKSSSETWESLTADSFASQFRRGVQEFSSIVGTSDPNLAEFRAAGGKMISYHGTADGLIPFKQMVHYYEEVLKEDSAAKYFYRFFEVPGLAHCSGGNGGQPTATWAALVAWAENGIAPDSMAIDIEIKGQKEERKLFPYPQMPYTGVDRNPGHN